MDLKKFFMNNKAVSPVIGVILMVAITVILAAAIGSSVFGQGTAESAPQANLDIQSNGFNSSNGDAGTIKIEHLGGDPINFDKSVTKIMVSVDGSSIQASPGTLGIISVGDVKKLDLRKDSGSTEITIVKGNIANIKIIDIKTSQLICDKNVRF
jgi:flagellin-like protein